MDFSQFELGLNSLGSEEPVFVKEALINLDPLVSDGHRGDLVGLSDKYAWLVHGRNAYIWHWTLPNPSCHSIHLAPSGLKYNSHLVSVYPAKGGLCGCVCVSPEGVIRHWKNAAFAQNFAETLVDLKSQVAHSLQLIASDENVHKFVLATSTCSLFLISLPTSGHQKVSVEPVNQASSVMSGIGRRMSSLLFSITPSAQAEMKLTRVIQLDNDLCVVLSSRGAQVCNVVSCTTVWIADMTAQLKQAAAEALWPNRAAASQRNELQVDIVDGNRFAGGLLLLVQVVNKQVSDRKRLFIGFIERVDIVPTEPAWIMPIPANQVSDEFVSKTRVFELFCGRKPGVLVLQPGNAAWFQLPTNPLDVIQAEMTYSIRLDDDHVLGCDKIGEDCMVFLQNSGLQSIKLLPRGFTNSSTMDITRIASERSVLNDQDMEDPAAKFKRAFLLFAKHQLGEASDEISELINEFGGSISTVVVGLARDIVDDTPTSDPRWRDNKDKGLMRENALNLFYQIEGKKKTLELLQSFISSVDLWSQMNSIETENGRNIGVRRYIEELNEKLDATLSLQSQPMKELQPMLDETYSVCIAQRNVELGRDLSPSDYFFTQISRFDDFVPNLVYVLGNELKTLQDASDKSWLLCVVSQLIMQIYEGLAIRNDHQGEKSWFLHGKSEQRLNDLIHFCMDCVSQLASPAQQGRLAEKIKEISHILLAENEVIIF